MCTYIYVLYMYICVRIFVYMCEYIIYYNTYSFILDLIMFEGVKKEGTTFSTR